MTRTKLFWRSTVLLVAVVTVTAVWRYETPSSAATIPRTQSTPTQPAAAAPDTQPAASATVAGPAERRLDLAALRRSLAGRADSEAEVQRILAFARFQDQVAAYGKNRQDMSDADRRVLAQQILGELPEHVANDEVLPVQAEALSAALMTDVYSDPGTRSAALQTMQQQWNAYAQQTVGPSPAQDPRFQTYQQQAQQIVQQVHASVQDPEQQQVVLGQRLQALRTQLYDGAPQSGTP
ncbi:phospholipase C accessory protein PlcR [Paraburkholderia sp.]|uniref:phospholipase C accessory protein PlcR n=1 Tax=Paraburkholderia sp. TaxID=1926495 RepID=UPI003D6FD01C